MDDPDLRSTLQRLPPGARADLRKLLIRDQPDRDRIAEQLMRRRTEGANRLAELIDRLSIDAETRRRVVRLLGEIEASA